MKLFKATFPLITASIFGALASTTNAANVHSKLARIQGEDIEDEFMKLHAANANHNKGKRGLKSGKGGKGNKTSTSKSKTSKSSKSSKGGSGEVDDDDCSMPIVTRDDILLADGDMITRELRTTVCSSSNNIDLEESTTLPPTGLDNDDDVMEFLLQYAMQIMPMQIDMTEVAVGDNSVPFYCEFSEVWLLRFSSG